MRNYLHIQTLSFLLTIAIHTNSSYAYWLPYISPSYLFDAKTIQKSTIHTSTLSGDIRLGVTEDTQLGTNLYTPFLSSGFSLSLKHRMFVIDDHQIAFNGQTHYISQKESFDAPEVSALVSNISLVDTYKASDDLSINTGLHALIYDRNEKKSEIEFQELKLPKIENQMDTTLTSAFVGFDLRVDDRFFLKGLALSPSLINQELETISSSSEQFEFSDSGLLYCSILLYNQHHDKYLEAGLSTLDMEKTSLIPFYLNYTYIF